MKKIIYLPLLVFLGVLLSPLLSESSQLASFDIEAHRGGRDRRPENTLAAFRYAIGLGVTTLELDTAVTRDRVVVVSHNPKLNYAITRDEMGKFIDRYRNIFIKDLTFEELEKYDVGQLNPASSYYYKHREQKPVPGERIPSLAEVFELTEEMHADNIRFNIEIKTYPPFPGYTIPRDEFVRLVIDVIEKYGMEGRVMIQSFDWNSLALVRKYAPKIPLGCLMVSSFHIGGKPYNLQPGLPGPSPWLAGLDYDDYRGHVSRLVKAFGGDVISPYYRDIRKDDVAEAHSLGLKMVVWTVDSREAMIRLISWGVDGIITDKPDLLLEVVNWYRKKK